MLPRRVSIVAAALLAACSHGPPRPTGERSPASDGGAAIDRAVIAPATPLDAAVVADAAVPSGPWDWAAIRASEGRWRRAPECDYEPPCPVWLLAAKVVSSQRGGGRTRVLIDLGGDDHVVVGMLGRLVTAAGRPDAARFAVTDLAARQAWAEAPGDVAVGSGHLLLWNPTVHVMPREPRDREHAEPEHVAHRARPRNARGDDAVVEDELDPAEAWRQIDEILTQHTGGERLPGLANSLDATGKGQLVARLSDLRMFSGDVVWDTLLAAGNSLAFAITFAPYGTTPVSKERVRKHVARLRAADLTDLTGAAFVELRKLFPGKLADELPTLVRDLSGLTGNPDVVRWWLTTTEPKLAAHRLATVADAALAKTCDEALLWDWLDDLGECQDRCRVSGGQLFRSTAPWSGFKRTTAMGFQLRV